jgi:hypothetical protein
MLKPCKDCGHDARYIPRRVTLCLPCKAARQRAYCRKVDYHRKRYARIAQGERERHLVRKYGVTQADYERMLAEQDGGCAICRKTQERARKIKTGICQRLSAKQRAATPIEFRDLLISLAASRQN